MKTLTNEVTRGEFFYKEVRQYLNKIVIKVTGPCYEEYFTATLDYDYSNLEAWIEDNF